MRLAPITVWGSSAWNGWATIADVAVASDGCVWTVDVARFATRWDPVYGHPISRVTLVPRGEGAVPTRAALLPDGRSIAIAATDGTLAVHDLSTGACRWQVVAVGKGAATVPTVAAMDVSRDGATLATSATGEREPFVRFWDAATGAERARVPGAAASVRLFPDGAHALVEGHSVVSIASRATVLEIPGRAPIGACTPDGMSVLTGGSDGVVACWAVPKLRAGETEPEWSKTNTDTGGDAARITDLQVSRDGVRAFTTSTRRHHTWFVTNGRRVRDLPFRGTWRVAVAPDAARVFGVELQRQRVRHLDLLREAEARPSHDHEEAITCVAISPDGTRVATGGRDDTIQVRDLATGRPLAVLPAGDVAAVAFTADSHAILYADDSGGGAYALATRERIAEWRWFALKTRSFVDIVATPDGTGAIACDERGTVLRFDLRTKAEVWRREQANARYVTFSGPLLAVTTTSCELSLCDADTGEVRAKHPIPDRSKTHSQIVLGEAVLAVQTGRGLVWRELASGRELRHFAGSEEADGLIAASPDGRSALTATAAGRVQLWDVGAARLAGELDLAQAHDSAKCAAFTPSGWSCFIGTNRGVLLQVRTSPPPGS